MNFTTKIFSKLYGITDEQLAENVYSNCKEFQPCNFMREDGTTPLAFSDSTKVGDVEYKVTVIFSEEQDKAAQNEDGVIEDFGMLEWDDPQEVIVEEV